MDKKKCLVVGAGFVGGTCYKAFVDLEGWDVLIYDKDPENSLLQKEFEEEINWRDIKSAKDADLVFVCTPTPMIKQTGECYTGIVEAVIKEVRVFNQNCWICIKSTVPPGTPKNCTKNIKMCVLIPNS